MIEDRYQLGEELGAGGFGVVRKALELETGAIRAIKIMHAADDAVRRRFEREAAVMQALRHDNLVGLHEVGETADGQLCLVLDYVDGGTLGEALDRGRLRTTEALTIVRDVLAALEVAHAAGVVHRDIKPSNILLTSDGQARLGDFGVARVSDASESLTATGAALGTLTFMAPEQYADASRVGPAADLYAVGATLYHVLTGDNPRALHLSESLADGFVAVPAPLHDVIVRATRFKPSDRFPDAATMRIALDNASVDLEDWVLEQRDEARSETFEMPPTTAPPRAVLAETRERPPPPQPSPETAGAPSWAVPAALLAGAIAAVGVVWILG